MLVIRDNWMRLICSFVHSLRGNQGGVHQIRTRIARSQSIFEQSYKTWKVNERVRDLWTAPIKHWGSKPLTNCVRSLLPGSGEKVTNWRYTRVLFALHCALHCESQWLPCYAEYSRQLDSEARNNMENIQESSSHQVSVIVRRWEN